MAAAAASELGDRAEGEDVAAGQHHGRVVGGGPLLGYGASEDLARREGEGEGEGESEGAGEGEGEE